MKPKIEISLTSPFSLRDLDYFLADARNNGIELDEPVTIAHVHKGYDDHFYVDGQPWPIFDTRLQVTTEEDE